MLIKLFRLCTRLVPLCMWGNSNFLWSVVFCFALLCCAVCRVLLMLVLTCATYVQGETTPAGIGTGSGVERMCEVCDRVVSYSIVSCDGGIVSYRIVSYGIVLYRIVSYCIVNF